MYIADILRSSVEDYENSDLILLINIYVFDNENSLSLAERAKQQISVVQRNWHDDSIFR